MADESAKRCIEVGAAPRAALVAVANFRVAGGGLGWQVAARFRPQPLTANRFHLTQVGQHRVLP
jgi:hypothetical protein